MASFTLRLIWNWWSYQKKDLRLPSVAFWERGRNLSPSGVSCKGEHLPTQSVLHVQLRLTEQNWYDILSVELEIVDRKPCSMTSHVIWGMVIIHDFGLGWCQRLLGVQVHIHSWENPWCEGNLSSIQWGGREFQSLARKVRLIALNMNFGGVGMS